MRWFGAILYILLWLIYLTFSIITFPSNESVLILIFLLVALGAWCFGRSIGLVAALVALISLYFITSVIYGDISPYYENRLSGPLLGITIVLLVGNLRSSYDALKAVNADLDQRVEKRNTELKNLTTQLLNDAEATRLRHGQTLHDGIGQQLTGIQLYCTSMEEQLQADTSPILSIFHTMRERAKEAHTMIRKTARMLFPARINETGLIPAIQELVSCLNEMEHVSIVLEVDGDFREIPHEPALGLYRLCHESAMSAATVLNARLIRLSIHEDATVYEVTLQHNGAPWSQLNETMEQKLMLYRLQALRGTFSSYRPVSGLENIIYRTPKI